MFEPSDLIHSYTRAQAIEDGVLVDVSDVAKEAGFKIHTVVTDNLFHTYIAPPAGLECQTAPKIDPQSASNFDPLELSVMASPRGRGGELIGFCV